MAKAFNKANPCPICSGTSGCAPSTAIPDAIACLRHESADLSQWHKIKDLANGMGALMRPLAAWERDRDEFSEEKRREWERDRERKQKQQQRQRQQQQQATDALDFSDRDRGIRRWLEKKTLSQKHQENLIKRGISDEALAAGMFRSLDFAMICPAFWGDRIIGYQYRLDAPGASGKYLWGKWESDSHLPNGDLPISAIGAPVDAIANLSEGILKPFVSQHRHGGLWIGAAGGNFPSNLLRKALKEFDIKRVRLWADAGSRTNPHVFRSYENLSNLLQEEGISLEIADWGQWEDKSKPDCDELPSDRAIAFRPASEFLQIDGKLWWQWKLDKEFKQWRSRYKFSAGVDLKQDYLDIPVPEEMTLTAIRSGLGTGKTTWLAEKVFKGIKNQGILQFGDKNNLLIQTCEKTGAYHIWSDDEFNLMMGDESAKLAACIHSIAKWEDADLVGKTLIFDEALTFVSTLLFSPHLNVSDPRNPEKTKREVCLEKLAIALGTAYRVVLLDAFLVDFTVDFFAHFAPHLKVSKIRNTSTKPAKRYIQHEGSVIGEKTKTYDYSGLLSQIQHSIELGESVAIASDSKLFTRSLYESLPPDLQSVAARIDGETSGDEWVKDFLENPDKFIDENGVRILIYSPAMGEGVSVDRPFERLFGFFSNTISASGEAQMLGRIRNCPEREFFNIPKGIISDDAPISPDCVARLWNASLTCDGEEMGGDMEAFKREWENQQHLIRTASIYQAIQNFEKKHPRECLKWLLELNGDEVEVDAPIGSGEVKQRFSEIKEEVKTARSQEIFNAEPIEESEVRSLQAKGIGGTYKQQCRIERFYLLQSFPGLDESEQWSPALVRLLKFDDRDIKSQIERWHLYQSPEDYSPLRVRQWQKKSMWAYRSRYLEASTLKSLPLAPILEADEFSGDSPIIRNWVEAIAKIPQCKARLGWQPRRDLRKKPIQSLNEMLARVGLRLVRVRTEATPNGNKRIFYRVDFSKHETPEWGVLTAAIERKLAEKMRKIEEWQKIASNSDRECDTSHVNTPLNYIKKGYVDIEDLNLDPSHSQTNVDPSHSQTNLDPSHSQTNLDPSHSQTNVDPSHSQTNLNHVPEPAAPRYRIGDRIPAPYRCEWDGSIEILIGEIVGGVPDRPIIGFDIRSGRFVASPKQAIAIEDLDKAAGRIEGLWGQFYAIAASAPHIIDLPDEAGERAIQQAIATMKNQSEGIQDGKC